MPYLSQETIIGAIAGPFNVDFATELCMIVHFLCFMLKVLAMIWLQMAIRWTLPRFRYDQVMDLCWKILLPLSIANILVTALVLLVVRGQP